MASYYFRNTGNTAWTTASNWSLTDGGGATGAVPLATDDAFFSNNSGNVVCSGAPVCKTLDFTKGTGFTGTISLTNPLVVSGNVTLNAGMGTISGAGSLTLNASATLTSNGKVWGSNIVLAINLTTYTFADNWTITGLTTLSTSTINGNTLTMNGGLTTVGNPNGTTNFVFGGGTFSSTISSNLGVQNNITINSAGSVSIGTAVAPFVWSGGTFTYTAGTITQAYLSLWGGSAMTFNTSGMTFNSIATSNNTIAQTFTLSSTLNATSLTLGFSAILSNNIVFAGSAGFNVGSLTIIFGNSTKSLTLASGVTYNVNTSFTLTSGTSAIHQTIKSSTGGVKAILTLKNGASQDLSFVNFTDIDASAGKTIGTYKGTIATSLNVKNLPVDIQAITN